MKKKKNCTSIFKGETSIVRIKKLCNVFIHVLNCYIMQSREGEKTELSKYEFHALKIRPKWIVFYELLAIFHLYAHALPGRWQITINNELVDHRISVWNHLSVVILSISRFHHFVLDSSEVSFPALFHSRLDASLKTFAFFQGSNGGIVMARGSTWAADRPLTPAAPWSSRVARILFVVHYKHRNGVVIVWNEASSLSSLIANKIAGPLVIVVVALALSSFSYDCDR